MTMTKAGEQPTITQSVDVFAERKAFEAWWVNWVPDGTMPSLTSHIFDAWLASARPRTTSLAAQDGLVEKVARAIWESSANITSSKYEHISADLKIMLRKRADAAIAVICPNPDTGTQALIAELAEALQRCTSYIESPLRMTSDSDEALRRTSILEKAHAAIAKATP